MACSGSFQFLPTPATTESPHPCARLPPPFDIPLVRQLTRVGGRLQHGNVTVLRDKHHVTLAGDMDPAALGIGETVDDLPALHFGLDLRNFPP